jgi:alpha-ketoglutarate-dependent taurine dioxygenase
MKIAINHYNSLSDFSVNHYHEEMNNVGVFIAQFTSSIDLLILVQKFGKPHSHNGDGNYVWDIKPIVGKTSDTVARSQTTEEFVFHTDCSFEYPPPRYVALYVIQEDRFGGGVTRLVDFRDVVGKLDEGIKNILSMPFQVKIPKEFYKDREYAQIPIIFENCRIAYRRECIVESFCTQEQIHALNILDNFINDPTLSHDISLHNGSLIFLDNTRYLHARTAIKDNSRHLQRIRYF